MLAYMRKIQEARRSDDGASAVEYALLIGAVAALLVVAVFTFNTFVKGIFDSTDEKLCQGSPNVPGCPAQPPAQP